MAVSQGRQPSQEMSRRGHNHNKHLHRSFPTGSAFSAGQLSISARLDEIAKRQNEYCGLWRGSIAGDCLGEGGEWGGGGDKFGLEPKQTLAL